MSREKDILRGDRLCPVDAHRAMTSVLTAIARVDAINASLPLQSKMDVYFVLHKADIY